MLGANISPGTISHFHRHLPQAHLLVMSLNLKLTTYIIYTYIMYVNLFIIIWKLYISLTFCSSSFLFKMFFTRILTSTGLADQKTIFLVRHCNRIYYSCFLVNGNCICQTVDKSIIVASFKNGWLITPKISLTQIKI